MFFYSCLVCVCHIIIKGYLLTYLLTFPKWSESWPSLTARLIKSFRLRWILSWRSLRLYRHVPNTLLWKLVRKLHRSFLYVPSFFITKRFSWTFVFIRHRRLNTCLIGNRRQYKLHLVLFYSLGRIRYYFSSRNVNTSSFYKWIVVLRKKITNYYSARYEWSIKSKLPNFTNS